MLYPVERRGRKRVQSSASLYPLIYRHAQQFVESLVASACASPAGPIIHAAQLTKSGNPPPPADSISLKGEALSSGRTMDMLEVVVDKKWEPSRPRRPHFPQGGCSL